MASVWKKAMLYLGLGPDEEYDDYVPDPTPPPDYDRGSRSEAPATVSQVPGAAGQSGYGSVRQLSPQPVEAAPERIGPASGIGAVAPARARGVVRPLAASATAKPQVITPTSFNDAQEVADRFKTNNPVIMNLQAADRDLARRLIDFASGLCYGLGGGMEKVAHQVYLITPTNVEVSAEERRRLERGQYA
jgi:cell division inhibitor SepF